ncbi:MAG: helix-turn-helix domain-containing protein [Balneolia bacterium]|nr:helix-turn-helix domain-containing protein [Balneolia bacterium]
MEPLNTEVQIPVSRAKEVLLENMRTINSAFEWSLLMNWSCLTRFSRRFRKVHGKRPSQMLIETKIEKAIKLLQRRHELSCFEIAELIGKTDDKALNKFLKHHTGKAPSWYRKNPDYRFEASDIYVRVNGRKKDTPQT